MSWSPCAENSKIPRRCSDPQMVAFRTPPNASWPPSQSCSGTPGKSMAASEAPKPPKPPTMEQVDQALVDVGGFADIVDGDDDELGDDIAAGEEVLAASESTGSDEFALIMAELENMMMDESFNSKVDAFTEQHCDEFEDSEENKLVYTSLFSEYTKLLEAHIEETLGAALKGFDMQKFCASLSERSDAKVRRRRCPYPPPPHPCPG